MYVDSPEGSQSHQMVKYSNWSRRTRNQESCWRGPAIRKSVSVCGGEGQLMCECPLKSDRQWKGVTISIQSPFVVEEEAPLLNNVHV